MQRLLAMIGLGAAATFVAYSAVTLHNTAFHLTSLEWQRPWAAAAAALLVVWEALALVFAGVLWTQRQRIAAAGCVVLLVAGVAFTFRLELVNQIQGSADTLAGRVQIVRQAVIDQEQLAALQKQRAVWTAKLETVSQRERRELRAELDRLNSNIETIIKRQNERPAIAEVTPEAALAARLLGGDEARWRDWMALMLIAFWPLARIIATPAAFAFWTIAFKRAPKEEIHKGPLIDATPAPEPAQLSGNSGQLEPPAEPKEKPKKKALPASGGMAKKVLPFRLADAAPVRLASLDDVVAYVTSHLPNGRHYFSDILKEVEHVAEKHFLPKPHAPVVGGMVAAHLGVRGRRDGSLGNATFYTVKRNNRAAKVYQPGAGAVSGIRAA